MPFDTQAATEHLEEGGMPREQASRVSNVILLALHGSFPTRGDLRELEARTDVKFAELRADMDARFAELREDIDVRFAKVDVKFAELRTEIEQVRTEVARAVNKLLAAQIVIAGLIVAALKYLP